MIFSKYLLNEPSGSKTFQQHLGELDHHDEQEKRRWPLEYQPAVIGLNEDETVSVLKCTQTIMLVHVIHSFT